MTALDRLLAVIPNNLATLRVTPILLRTAQEKVEWDHWRRPPREIPGWAYMEGTVQSGWWVRFAENSPPHPPAAARMICPERRSGWVTPLISNPFIASHSLWGPIRSWLNNLPVPGLVQLSKFTTPILGFNLSQYFVVSQMPQDYIAWQWPGMQGICCPLSIVPSTPVVNWAWSSTRMKDLNLNRGGREGMLRGRAKILPLSSATQINKGSLKIEVPGTKTWDLMLAVYR